MQEIWKDVIGYEGLYQVSNQGRVRSLDRNIKVKIKHNNKALKKGKILKIQKGKSGYIIVALCKDGKVKHYRVHRLVAAAFIDNPENKPYVNHINGDKTDNRVENLEFCTQSENVLHSYKIKLRIINEEQKERIREIGKKSSKQILQYNLEGNFIKTWDSTYEIERQLKIPHTNISKCCKNKLKTAGGYIWRYKDIA